MTIFSFSWSCTLSHPPQVPFLPLVLHVRFVSFFLFSCAGSLLLQGLLSSCREQGLLCISVPGFPIAVASLVVELSTRVSHRCGFSGCDSWPLQSTGSVVVLNGLSCSSVCGIFLDQGWNPCPLHWQVNSLPLSHRGSRSYAS